MNFLLAFKLKCDISWTTSAYEIVEETLLLSELSSPEAEAFVDEHNSLGLVEFKGGRIFLRDGEVLAKVCIPFLVDQYDKVWVVAKTGKYEDLEIGRAHV